MVTLKNIAEQVGVSIPLVSKVLNASRGGAGASKKTAALIRETAAQMGYRRNRAAVALRAGRQDAIGAILHQTGAAGSGITEATIGGIAEEAILHDQRQELALYETPEQFGKLLDKMDTSVVDGLIIGGVLHRDLLDRIAAVQRAGLPVVTLYDGQSREDVANVGYDVVDAGRQATQHLIDQGCKRVAYIARSMAEPMLTGYREVMAAAAIEISDEWICSCRDETYTRQSGEEAVAVLDYRGINFDGLVCHCDLFAMGAIRALTRKGKSVPGDVRVIGMDNSPFCDLLPVTLSSMAQEISERSRLAVRMLIDLRDGKNVESVVIKPKLHPRESSG